MSQAHTQFGKINGEGYPAFLSQFNPAGSSLVYSTLLGGTADELAVGVSVDANHGVYLTGTTTSTDFPTSAGAIEKVSSNPYIPAIDSSFVTKLDLSSAVSCILSISPSSLAVPFGSVTSSFAITVPQGCPWVLYNQNPSAITINGPTSGFGNATVNFSVFSSIDTNTAVAEGILVGASTFSITTVSCYTPILSPSSATFGSMGGQEQFNIAIPSGCPYTAVPSAPWISITSGSSGNSSGTINIVVARDDFASRSGTVAVSGTSVPVTQTGAGCTASASVNAGSGNTGGTGAISLATSSNTCVWEAYSLAPWIQLGSTSGTGSATVGIVLAPNPGNARIGQIQIAGQTLTISQLAGPAVTPAAYKISTIAGTGTAGFTGDGAPATSAQLASPVGVAYDASGNLYIADSGNNRIRGVALNGTISTVAGNGSSTYSGDGGSATAAGIASPYSIAIGPAGDLYVSESTSQFAAIRKITAGVINGFFGALGYVLYSMAVDAANNVYVGAFDYVQKVTSGGTVSNLAGNGTASFTGDGGPATSATLGGYVNGLAFDSASNLYLADTNNQRVRKIAASAISTVAGTGTAGFNGDGVATSSTLDYPGPLATDPMGNVVVLDVSNNRVRRFTPGGNIVTIAGNGNSYYSGEGISNGDGGPALSAKFGYLSGVAIDPFGNIAVSDRYNNVVRLLTPNYSVCTYTLSASSATAAPAASVLNPSVTANTGCPWNVYSQVSWITVGTSAGSGSGAVTLNLLPNNTGSMRTGVVNIAGSNYTVTQQPGVITLSSVTPNAASGTSQVLTAVYSDTAGAIALVGELFLINSGINGAGACYVQVYSGGIYLVNDAGSGVAGPLTGSGTLSNSQCTLNGAGSGVASTGNNLTLTISITFNSSFAGAKSIYMYTADSTANTGWQARGTYTVTSLPAAVSVSPGSASGTSQVFTAVYSDTAGATALTGELFLINSGINGGGACYVQVYANSIYLVNDAGSAVIGPLTGSGTLSNSQCTLNGAGSGVASAGNNLTLTISITFKSSFAGAKSIYMYAADSTANTGWQTRGTYTLTSMPATVSVTPSAASGTSQVFTAVYSDTAGASALAGELFLINAGINGGGACYVQVYANSIYLVNDAGSAVTGPLTGSATLSNSQCTLNGTGSGVTSAGNNVTLTLSITFTSSFAGAKSIYMYTADSTANTGWQARGSYTVTSVPAAVSVTPSAASGTSQVFTAVYSDTAGASALAGELFLINAGINGGGSCYVQIYSGGIYLVNDAGSGVNGPLTGSGTLSNSQCTLNGSGSGVTSAGNNVTATISITFTSSFAGAKSIYMYTADSTANTGWQARGTYTVTSLPAAVSVSPSSASGTSQVFTAVYSDTAGATALTGELFLINSGINGGGACYVQIYAGGIYLVNDAGSAVIGPLTGSGTLSNSQCTLNGAGSGVTSAGNNVTLTISITFNSSFAGAKSIYMYTADSTANTGWQTKGTFTVN